MDEKEPHPIEGQTFKLKNYPFKIKKKIISFLICLKSVLGKKLILYFPRPILFKIVFDDFLSKLHFLKNFRDFDDFYDIDILTQLRLLRGIYAYGFEKPTTVQSYVLDPLLKGFFFFFC